MTPELARIFMFFQSSRKTRARCVPLTSALATPNAGPGLIGLLLLWHWEILLTSATVERMTAYMWQQWPRPAKDRFDRSLIRSGPAFWSNHVLVLTAGVVAMSHGDRQEIAFFPHCEATKVMWWTVPAPGNEVP